VTSRTVHIHLGEERKQGLEALAGTNIFETVQDLVVVTRLLVVELVTRECQNLEASAAVFLVQRVEARIFRPCQPSEGGDIDDEGNFAGIVAN